MWSIKAWLPRLGCPSSRGRHLSSVAIPSLESTGVAMTDQTPHPSIEELTPGTEIVVRARPRTPIRVVDVWPYPGAKSGFLVQHDGPGVPVVCGSNVRIFPRR